MTLSKDTYDKKAAYAKEHSREKYGTPLEQLTKALMDKQMSDWKMDPGGRGKKEADAYRKAYEGKGKPAPASKPPMSTKGDKATPPKPTSRPARAPKLADGGSVKAAPKPRSAREGKEMAERATERRANYLAGGPDRQRKSGTNVSDMAAKKGGAKDSDDAGYNLAKKMGDKRTKEDMVAQRKAANKADRENR
jgi:hypothetical protein